MKDDLDLTTGVRLPKEDRLKLDKIARKNFNTPSGMIRMAVSLLIAEVAANNGELPPAIAELRDRAEASQPEAAASAGGR